MCCLENLRHFSDLSVISRLGSEGPTVQWNSLYHHKIEIRNKIAFSLYSSFFSIRYIPKVKSPVSTLFFFKRTILPILHRYLQFWFQRIKKTSISRIISNFCRNTRNTNKVYDFLQCANLTRGHQPETGPPLHFSNIIYRYNLWRSMIKIVHPRRLGLRIAENRRLCSCPVCCGSNLRIKIKALKKLTANVSDSFKVIENSRIEIGCIYFFQITINVFSSSSLQFSILGRLK